VPRSYTGARLAGLVLLAGSVAILVAVTAIPGRGGYGLSGPRLIPLLVGIALVVLSVLFLLRTVVRPDAGLGERGADEDEATHWPTPARLAGALVAYALLLEPLGYVVATALFFAPVAALLGSRAIVRDAIVGVVLAVVLFAAFTQLLGVSLPAGLTPVF